jgi:hypothetical protein
MCCMTLVAPGVTVATTQLMRTVCSDACWTREEVRTEFRPPRMNWVVVTDENQNRRMQMSWAASVEDR